MLGQRVELAVAIEVEPNAIGPGPFAALLGDMGADVIRINRPGADVGDGTDVVDSPLARRSGHEIGRLNRAMQS